MANKPDPDPRPHIPPPPPLGEGPWTRKEPTPQRQETMFDFYYGVVKRPSVPPVGPKRKGA